MFSVSDTVAAGKAAEIWERSPALNTAIMSTGHVETTEELRDAIRRFVANGKVVSLEEGRLLRMTQQVADEAMLLDYALRLLACGLKENGVWGQRYQQLFREAEAFRAGMLERHDDEAA